MCKNECLHSSLRAVLLGTVECRPVHLTAMFNQISGHIATGFCASAHTTLSVPVPVPDHSAPCQLPVAGASSRCKLPVASASSRCQLPVASASSRCQVPVADVSSRCQLQSSRCQRPCQLLVPAPVRKVHAKHGLITN